jgi:chaperone required for assembly of F1-ATPase
MTDDLTSLFSVDDAERRAHPMRSAQAGMRKALPKRFYAEASIGEFERGYRLLLDGKPALTPKRAALALPVRRAAEMLAAEWNAQQDVIDPARMPATRMTNAAIDHVAEAMDAVREDAARYIASDLVCYRASDPERLVELQRIHWDPMIDFAERRLGIRPVLAEGVVFKPQDSALAPAYLDAIRGIAEPAALAAFHVLVTLSGSAIIALALCERHVDAEAAFAAAELDFDFSAEVWGQDEEAQARYAARKADFLAASALFHALR